MKQLHEIAIGGISKGGRATRQRAARKNGRSAYPFLVPSAYGKLAWPQQLPIAKVYHRHSFLWKSCSAQMNVV